MPGRHLSRWYSILSLLAVLALPATLAAQEAPMSGGGGNGLVVYTLPSSDPTRLPNTGPYSASFWVVNTGLDEAVADFSCAVTGPVTCANVSPSSATISVGDSIAVGLSYSTLTGPGNGIITLTATLEGATPPTSSGAKNVGVYPAGKGVVVLGNRNQDNLDRGLCLTVGAGEAAGLSCGDLITTAGLPAYRTLGRDRSLGLHYNSATATGLNLVTARVSLPATIAMPTTIRAILTVNGTLKDSTVYAPPSTYSCGYVGCADSFQVVLGRNLTWASLATGYYPYAFTVRTVYPSGVHDSTLSGQLLVINRSASEYGRGWGLLGVEQVLTPADTTQRVWVAGDGSARVFHRGVPLAVPQLSANGVGNWNSTKAVDGFLVTTAWTTNGSTPTSAYVRADLGAAFPQAVTSVRLYALDGNNATYDVQYSSNGTSWTTVLAGFKPQAGWSSVVWSSVGAYRYWRLKVAITNSGTSTIRELSFGSANNFYAAPGDAPDSLVRFDTLCTPGCQRWYRRELKHGARVTLDPAGRHQTTTNRVGAITSFHWSTITPVRLDSVTVPPNSTPRRTYRLFWNGTTRLLDSIRDPGGRRLRAVITSGNLTKLVAPGNLDSTRFAYDVRNVMVKRIATRQKNSTKGDSAVTTFSYANNARVTQVAVQADSAGTQNAVTAVTPWDQYGITTLFKVDTAGPATRLDGPLAGTADATDFWVDRFGQLKRSVLVGLGLVTRVWHDSAGMPGLVTRVAFPHPAIAGDSGRVVRLSWNARGNLIEQRELTAHVKRSATDQTLIGFPPRVTRYTYPVAVPDSPDSVIGPDGRFSRYKYNGQGLTDSVFDPRGLVTSFVYQAPGGPLAGTVLSIREGTTSGTSATRSFTYNADGNMQTAKSAIGATTSYESDNLGRIIAVYDPYGWKTGYTLDALNRVTRSELYKQLFSHPTEPSPLPSGYLGTGDEPLDASWPTSVPTQYGYAPTGQPDSVVDPRGVKRWYRYDARGLVVREVDDTGRVKRAFHSVAGLLDSVRMRNGLTTRFRYDAYGRRTAMIFPQRVQQSQELPETLLEQQIPGCCIRSDTIPGDSVGYTYNLLGQVTRTINRWGTITRSYYADGALETKMTQLASGGGLGVEDSLRYVYDSVGARTWLYFIGEAGQSNTWRDSVRYTYNAQGDLDTLRACFGKAGGWPSNLTMPPCRDFRFTWDSLGRRKTLTYPNGAVITYTHDLQDVLVGVAGVKNGNEPPTGKSDRFDFSYTAYNVNAVGRIHGQSYACHDWSTQDPYSLPCGDGGHTRATTSAYNIRGELLRQVTLESNNTYSDTTGYDVSGNLGRRARWDGVQQRYTRDDFSSGVGSNRLASSIRTDLVPWTLTYEYDADGARVAQRPTPRTNATVEQDRRWLYDALGRQAGYKYVEWVQGAPMMRNYPTDCWYDPEGQVYRPCQYGNQPLLYEGVNVSRFGSNSYRFIHAGGVDDVLMARFYPGSGTQVQELYFVTDGQGRELAAADFDGSRVQTGWGDGSLKWAGLTAKGSSFDATRMGNSNTPGVSLFRNRSYDANSGRWLQEDPIGIAGGINLYQFSGNNPVMFTDPFGLKVCFHGSPDKPGDVTRLKRGVERATNTDISLDENNCVKDVTTRKGKGYDQLRGRFKKMVESEVVFGVRFATQGEGSRFDEKTNTAVVSRFDIAKGFYTTCSYVTPSAPFSIGAVITHELIGHGHEVAYSGTPASQDEAILQENRYHKAVGEPDRCGS